METDPHVIASFQAHYEMKFPNLAASGWRLDSPRTFDYNCIAWAAGDKHRWWEPPDPITGQGAGKYWPRNLSANHLVETYVHLYELSGYKECPHGRPEKGYEKVAIYAMNGNVLHAAKQLPSGYWSSKLGPQHDIIHHTLEALEGNEYGYVAKFMKRQRQGKAGKR